MELIKQSTKNKKKNIDVNVSLFVYKEDGLYVAYCPSLDLVTTGHNPTDARANFKELLQIYFEECTRKGTLFEDLQKHGWFAA